MIVRSTRTERGSGFPSTCTSGGEEHAVLHLLYSRFLTMVLHELGHVEFEEPYRRFRKHGLLIKEGAKIGKSRGNVVLPDDYITHYGADVFRTYLMFLGPFQVGGDFRDVGIAGPERFLRRAWDSVVSAIDSGRQGLDDVDVERALHATVKTVTEDLESLDYNTAIAALMDYLNTVRADGRVPSIEEVRPLIIMLAPFAPHFAEELWERSGGEPSLFDSAVWPDFDESKLHTDDVEIPVQINGKLRATIRVERWRFTGNRSGTRAAAGEHTPAPGGSGADQGDPRTGPHAQPGGEIGPAVYQLTSPSCDVSISAPSSPSPNRNERRLV